MKFNKTYKLALKGGQILYLDPCSYINNVCKELESFKQKEFMEQVLNELKDIDMTIVEKNDFLNRTYLTSEVIKKAQSNDKIKLLTLLFVKSIIFYSELNNDDFELFIKIIDSLTYKEFIILKALLDEERKLIKKLKASKDATEDAYNGIKEKLKIDDKQLRGYIDRLKGQGLLEMLSGFASTELRLHCGNTSQLFKNLVDFLDKSNQPCHYEE